MITIGQRRGIGLPGGGPKRYVVDVDVAAGVVTVGDDADLMRVGMRVTDVTWTDAPHVGPVRVQCQRPRCDTPGVDRAGGRAERSRSRGTRLSGGWLPDRAWCSTTTPTVACSVAAIVR